MPPHEIDLTLDLQAALTCSTVYIKTTRNQKYKFSDFDIFVSER